MPETRQIGLGTFDPKFTKWIDQKVEAIYNGKRIVGNLWFAGINGLHNQYQVTLNRTPYWPVDPNSIKLFVDKSTKVINNN